MKQMSGITPAEWNLMECLWEKSPMSAREVVDVLSERIGWSRSTILTMLRRLTEKELIGCDDSGTVKMYSAVVDREKAVAQETGSFLKRVYQGDLGKMLCSFVESQNLSEEELAELVNLLQGCKKE